MNIRERISKLREIMAEEGFNAYLIGSSDPHQSEYTAPCFKAREYMSGFTGSAGTLIVTRDKAFLFTDGRYFIQAENQLKGTGITLMRQGEKDVPGIPEFLSRNSLYSLGFDPRTVSMRFIKELTDCDEKFDRMKVSPDTDLVGRIWDERPPMSFSPIFGLDVKYAGCPRREKTAALRKALDTRRYPGKSAFVISALDEIAWLLNIRSSDVKYTPVALAFLVVHPDSMMLFAGEGTVDEELAAELAADGVTLRPYGSFYSYMEELGTCTDNLIYDDTSFSHAAYRAYEEGCAKACKKPLCRCITSPVKEMKAVKSPTECENIRKAHIMDAVAVTKLIYFMKTADRDTIRSLDEIAVSDKLDEFRKQGEGYLYQSFDPISAYGKNGAIVHYSADENSNTPLDDRGFLLLDTGGQYLCGTTDITRTIALGELTLEEKRAYTAVLKGNLRLAAAVFAKGCSGVNLDILARKPIWDIGCDYNHGTGHGVGYCLSVHEGPQGIRMRDKSPVPFQPGMLTSDEPGVYIDGKFGIRLENLMLCREYDEKRLCFETVTLVPFDMDAILWEDMTPEDTALLSAYHKRVCDAIAPLLDHPEREWLEEICNK